MKCKELNPTTFRHLRHSPFCTKCGKYIDLTDDVQYIKVRNGRCVTYNFYHATCLERKVEYESV